MDSDFLFAGLRFDRKKFGRDVRRFKVGANGSAEKGGSDHVRDSFSTVSSDPGSRNKNKRKRKEARGHSFGARIDFNMFKSPGLVTLSEDFNDHADEVVTTVQPEEAARLLRKQHRIHVAGSDIPPPLLDFRELRSMYACKINLMRSIQQAGYREPTPIQRQAIPVLLNKRQCLACAPTGSGKTLAFSLPIAMSLKNAELHGPRAVILCPTRELGAQIAREFKRLVRGKVLRIRALTKTLTKCADFRTLPCDVLVSTPLRLDILLKSDRIDLSFVEFLVLDEADKLFEMGFVDQIDAVVSRCSGTSVVKALFSATLPDMVEELAQTIMHDVARITVGERNSASKTIDQRLVFVGSEEGKLLALKHIFEECLQPPILLFVQSKERAKEVHQLLVLDDINVDSIHADRPQAQRDLAVENFRAGKTWVLIATDVMARGMDFKGVNCVINYDLPHTTASYIHRIGRSGRAGRPGRAISLYTEDDAPFLRSIANIMRASECTVPQWMLSLPKTKWKGGPPKRMSTV